MAINLKLILARPVDPGTDAWGRTWFGWDPRRSDLELWEQNRGVWKMRNGAESDESLATLSFDGTIRVVARIRGSERVWDPISGTEMTALEGDVLPPGDPVRDALVGTAVDRYRNPVTYPDTSTAESFIGAPVRDLGGRATYLLTHNPAKWPWDPSDRAAAVRDTRSGVLVRGDWSTGKRTHVEPGDRVFLLQQGDGIRGVVASGHLTSRSFVDTHFDDPGRLANYALLEWDTVLDEQEALLTDDLVRLIPSFGWRPQGSGELLPEPAASELESLWASHVKRPTPNPRQVLGGGQAWLADPAKRKQAEDHGQRILEDHYRSKGWQVQDTRVRNPYDAIATKPGMVLYLEAKATQTMGDRVLVTSGEVTFARDHPGECVMGVVSGIRFDQRGQLDVSSGTLKLHDWSPQDHELEPIQYRWTPSAPPIG